VVHKFYIYLNCNRVEELVYSVIVISFISSSSVATGLMVGYWSFASGLQVRVLPRLQNYW
jgi:hypothetical protein